ncbi:MAG: hypothetical protein P8Z79_08095 [Sedimentisphaerales bacterium]|jgi:hypothetical protein
MSKLRDVVLIMKDVSRIAADLMKYQVDRVADTSRRVLTNVLTWFLVFLAAMALAFGGLILILWGVYLKLSAAIGPSGSAVIIGVLLLLGATILFLSAKSLLKD